jgi:hypothetical protein
MDLERGRDKRRGKPHYEKLNHFYRSQNIIKTTKLRKIKIGGACNMHRRGEK